MHRIALPPLRVVSGQATVAILRQKCHCRAALQDLRTTSCAPDLAFWNWTCSRSEAPKAQNPGGARVLVGGRRDVAFVCRFRRNGPSCRDVLPSGLGRSGIFRSRLRLCRRHVEEMGEIPQLLSAAHAAQLPCHLGCVDRDFGLRLHAPPCFKAPDRPWSQSPSNAFNIPALFVSRSRTPAAADCSGSGTLRVAGMDADCFRSDPQSSRAFMRQSESVSPR